MIVAPAVEFSPQREVLISPWMQPKIDDLLFVEINRLQKLDQRPDDC